MIDIKQWLFRMGQRVSRFMYGRYGSDQLNRFLTYTSLVLMILSLIPRLWLLWIPALVLLIWSYCRTFSRKIYQRRRENEIFLKVNRPLTNWLRLQKNKHRDRKTHRYFRCSHCRAVLRVPRGKGKIDVTCPKCKRITVKKT